ncbi:hypothetical protein [Rhodopirellula bahusiensis]|uniref:hypothetical protein n=1 Tax=Rhodopirellula bahusiensis TaxID=2014065 RepID=UPI003265FAE5
MAKKSKKKSRSRKKSKVFSAAQAEKLAKKAAEKRTIEIELTDEQLDALSKQWSKLNPTEAAQLIFTDGKRATSKIKVAGYSYHGNTCCA